MATAQASDTKVCPFCAEEVKAAAILCRYCRSEMSASPKPPAIVAEVVTMPTGDGDGIEETIQEAREILDDSSREGVSGLVADVNDVVEYVRNDPELMEKATGLKSFLESISLKS